MKIACIIVLIGFLGFQRISAQNVGIGTNTPHPSAQLDISSNSKGVLVPRLTGIQRLAIAAPAAGLLVFDTDSSAFAFYNGGSWIFLNGNGGNGNTWDINGSNINSHNSGYVGIGINPTRAKLEVNGVAGTGYTSGMFGSDGAGISLERNNPTIGFNQYNDGSSKFMSTGYAALQYLNTTNGYMSFYMLGTGDANTATSVINPALTLAKTGYVGIGGVDPSAPLSFENTLGNKISLWNNGPGADYGIGLQPERLLMYTGTRIEMGTGDANSFSNSFTFNAANGNMFSKQTGSLNLVPLGAVSFQVVANNCTINIPSTSFSNNAGNIVLSQTSGSPTCGNLSQFVESDLYLNPVVTSQYSKIIVVGGPETKFNNLDDQLVSIGGEMQGNSQYHIEGVWNGSGGYKIITGTVLFYGIK